MLASISESLRDHGLSLDNVTTELQTSKVHGVDFVVQADCVSTKYMTQDEIMNLIHELSQMKQELGLDIIDVRVHRLTHGNDEVSE
jgi:cell division ATPase FtsA